MKSSKLVQFGAAIVLLSCLSLSLYGGRKPGGPTGRGSAVHGREILQPLLFEEYRAQAFAKTGYLARIGGVLMLLTPEEVIWVRTSPAGDEADGDNTSASASGQIRMACLGRNPGVRPLGEQPTVGSTTYIRGGVDGASRIRRASHHRRVRYAEIYSGIDLVFHGDRGRPEFDFVLSPGADPSRIRLRFTGAGSVSIGADGELLLTSGSGTLQQSAPKVLQRIDGRQVVIPAGYRLHADDTVSIALDEPYSADRELIIDPVLGFSGYHGGSADEVPGAIAVDSEGNLYMAGSTGSLDFPLRNPVQEELAGGGSPNGDAFITKLDPTGSTVLYSTYLGGSGTEIARGIAVDGQGRAIITGTTFSEDFPVTSGAYQTSCSGGCPFVVMLSADGSDLVYSTFVGRGDGEAVAVDSSGRAVVTGRTADSDFPVKNAFQPNRGGGWDAFAFELDESGSQLVFSTFLGGSGDENLSGRRDIAVDVSDNVYVVGRTASPDFPTLNAIQSGPQGEDDAFVAKLNGQGGLVYATYLGGSQDDGGQGIAVDLAGNAYVTGVTLSDDFPTTAGSLQTAFGGGAPIGDAFLAKLAPQGGSLVFASYLGGAGGDTGVDVAVDDLGRAVVVGSGSLDFPTKDPFRHFDGVRNFVTKFNLDGSELVYSTPIGGGDADIAAATTGSKVLIAGNISTGTLPVLNARQPRLQGGTDAFLVEVSDAGVLHFAQFGNGTAAGTTIVSEILLTNSSEASPSHATVTLLDDDGAPLPLDLTVTGDPETAASQPQTSELQLTVAPLGAVRIATDGLGDVLTGSVRVTFDNPLGGVIRFSLDPNGTAGVGASQLVRGFITPVRSAAISAGVAISNPGDQQIGVTMRLRGTNGQQVPGGLRSLALAAGEHLAKFVDELFPNADLSDFEGTLTVTTGSLNALLVATALELGPQPGQFTTLPVTPIP